jgi:hypothetical protein
VGDLLQLEEVRPARVGVFMDAIQMRLVPSARPLHVERPHGLPEVVEEVDEARPGLRSLLRHGEARQRRVGQRHTFENAGGGSGTDTGQQLQHAEPGDPVARVLRKAQDRDQVLDVRRLQELQAADLDEGDVAPGQLDLQLLTRRLELEAPGVSKSILEGLDEILTVTRLGLPPDLRRSLASTNIIEEMNAVIRQVCRNVKRWRDAKMALRWTVAGMLEAAKGFRRLKACRQLPALKAAFEKHRASA